MIYLDSSFLVLLYSLDVHSQAASRIQQTADGDLLLSTLGEFETINALRLRVFRKEISHTLAEGSQRLFENDLRNRLFRLQPLPESVFERARRLSGQWVAQLGTRAFDVVHVAAALEFGATGFFSFDLQQRKMAQAVGLKLCTMPKRT